jgi:hypothetical protein
MTKKSRRKEETPLLLRLPRQLSGTSHRGKGKKIFFFRHVFKSKNIFPSLLKKRNAMGGCIGKSVRGFSSSSSSSSPSHQSPTQPATEPRVRFSSLSEGHYDDPFENNDRGRGEGQTTEQTGEEASARAPYGEWRGRRRPPPLDVSLAMERMRRMAQRPTEPNVTWSPPPCYRDSQAQALCRGPPDPSRGFRFPVMRRAAVGSGTMGENDSLSAEEEPAALDEELVISIEARNLRLSALARAVTNTTRDVEEREVSQLMRHEHIFF